MEGKNWNESIFNIFTKQVQYVLVHKLLYVAQSRHTTLDNQKNVVNCVKPFKSFLNEGIG